MGAVDLVDPGRVAEVGRARAAAHRPRRPLARRGLEGAHLPEVPRRPARVARSSSQRMREGAIEETQIPRNPLDVLAQQIVAICADEEIEVDELHDLVRGAYPFADLSRAQLENVLDMLAGRYPSDEFAELRPRIVWDRTARRRSAAAQGARRLAVTNAGHDPRPRPLRRLPRRRRRPRRRARRGDGLRGARRPGVPARRVVVADRGDHARPRARLAGAGRAGRGAVLEGRGRRPAVRARRGDRHVLARAASRTDDAGDRAARRRRRPRRARGAQPPRRSCASRQRATGVVPSDRTVVVERFRDEIGDWRICILTPFGARVHAPWAMAVGARLRESLGIEVQSIWSDDGIAFHLPDADAPPPTDAARLDPDELEELVRRGGRADRALRRALPRERGARAADPAPPAGRAHAALAAAAEGAGAAPGRAQVRELPDRARDVPRVPAGRLRPAGAEDAAARAAHARDRPRRRRDARRASPFASSLLFDYIATYMYEDDTPPAERRAQALSLDRDLLRELLGQEELRELLDADALAEVEASLRPTAQDADELHDLLRLRGDLRVRRVRRGARGDPRGRAARGSRPHRRRGAADRGRGRRPLPRRARRDAAVGPAGRRSSRRRRTRCARSCCALRARARAVHDRRGERVVRRRRRAACCASSSATSKLVRGELRPGGTEREWCDPDVLRRLRRASLAALRREVEPVEQAALGRFLPQLARDRPPRDAARGA